MKVFPYAFPAHQCAFKLDIRNAALLSCSRAESKMKECRKDIVSPVGYISEYLFPSRALRCSLRMALCQYMPFHTIKLERTCVLEPCHLYQD